MTTATWYFIIYFAGAAIIGIPLGMKSFNLLVDDNFGLYSGIPIGWKLTIFPLYGASQKFSENLPLFHCLLRIRKKEDADFIHMFWYVILTALFWPVRVAWNLVGMIVLIFRLIGILPNI